MRKFKVRKQIRNLYFITAIGSFQIAGASWVALLALRGFSIVQIGILESIFHVVSMCFEIPSGVVADVFGRRKTMIISQYLTLISGTFMILSNSFWTEVPANEKRCEDPILVQLQNCVKDSFAFLRENRKTRGIIFVNALIGSVATLMLFFLQAKLPEVGLKPALLGPALFVMGLGAAFGGKAVSLFTGRKYKSIVMFSITGIIVAVLTLFTGNPYVICAGGFLAAFSDDFLEVRTDILLNSMIPSEQRATLVSVCSFAFSVVMIVLSPIMGGFFS
ncbi:MAG: MFS transporter [Lachnospiraceae bacterium]|nr:MFS transporter [Lachnospiraceae bacterium]